LDEVNLVVGGGMAGLTACCLLRRKYPSAKVTLVERSAYVGGLLATFDYGRFGQFDRGMHWITETGIKDIDDLYLSLLPEQDWVFLEGSRRDLSGLFYSGKLQENTQFPDLRGFEREHYLACLAGFFANLNQPEITRENSLLSHARSRFGRLIADTVIGPIATKVHGISADLLDPMARYLPLLDRVVLFDEKIFLDLMASSELRARLAFPEQRCLPLSYSSGRRSHYPRRYGIGRVIDALVARLRECGVELLTDTRVRSLDQRKSHIQRVEIEHAAGGRQVLEPVQRLVWTGDAFPLADLLGLPLPKRPAPERRTVIVSMLLKASPRMGDLYCFFCADAPHSTYRVTNFSAFCPGARRADCHPICVELLVNWADGRGQNEYAEQAVQEILGFGLIDSPDDVLFSKAEPLGYGFPNVSRDSIRSIETVRDAIDGQKVDNLIRAGILAKKDQFFQHDVLIDLYHKIDASKTVANRRE
jgi:protoporphyrinogen oxidase